MNAITAPATTESVVRRHLEAFQGREGLAAILADYDRAACVFGPQAVYQGHEEIGRFFAGFMQAIPADAPERFRLHGLQVHGDLAFITWSVGDDIPLGVDTFVVRDGKIVSQTFAMHMGKRAAT